MKKEQFGKVSKSYASLAKIDPSKQYVQYPSALKLLGNIKGKNVLDIGCGDGHSSRAIASKGANVVGYDIAKEQIKIAESIEKHNSLGITYFNLDQYNFKSSINFDKACAILVLPYSSNKRDLLYFFKSAYSNTSDNGEFIAIIFNPLYKRYDVLAYNRIFRKLLDNKIKIEFYNSEDKFLFSAEASDFSKTNYEEAAKKAGFKKFTWKKLKVSKKGISALGERFWKNYENDCPYIGLIASKKA
ncbi:MAG: class I SAM-dependent methyltransferase [Nanoarchaeota archaeon]